MVHEREKRATLFPTPEEMLYLMLFTEPGRDIFINAATKKWKFRKLYIKDFDDYIIYILKVFLEDVNRNGDAYSVEDLLAIDDLWTLYKQLFTSS